MARRDIWPYSSCLRRDAICIGGSECWSVWHHLWNGFLTSRQFEMHMDLYLNQHENENARLVDAQEVQRTLELILRNERDILEVCPF